VDKIGKFVRLLTFRLPWHGVTVTPFCLQHFYSCHRLGAVWKLCCCSMSACKLLCVELYSSQKYMDCK